MDEANIVFYKGDTYLVYPGVYEPAEDTFLLVQNIGDCSGKRVLELGTGCGLVAITAAKLRGQIVATDINKAALECAKNNASAHGVADSIDFRLGHLFEPVRDERFDLILFNPPYLPVKSGEELGSPIDRAWEAGPEGRAVIDPFLDELPNHLPDSGKALFIQSSLSNLEKSLQKLSEHGFNVDVTRKKLSFEELYLLRVHW